jgi:hypothetical protein
MLRQSSTVVVLKAASASQQVAPISGKYAAPFGGNPPLEHREQPEVLFLFLHSPSWEKEVRCTVCTAELLTRNDWHLHEVE